MIGIIAALAIIAGLVTSYTGFFVADGLGEYDDFAKCLTEKGVVMYSTEFCPHCANQKKMFGSSFRYVTYVECTQQQQLCTEKGITSVPAWIIDGEKYTGEQSLQRLSELSGCSLS